MAEQENTNMEVKKKRTAAPASGAGKGRQAEESCSTAEYCEKLQAWMWQYYYGYVTWQSWLAASALSPPCCLPPSPADLSSHHWLAPPYGLVSPPPAAAPTTRTAVVAGGAAVAAQPAQENGNARRPGREYGIPSPFQRLLAEMVDFFILFFIKASIIISIMHLSGIKDVSKFAMHFIVEEIDEDTSMEELQKMMLVALVYRILPNRVLVVPASNVSLSASTVRALNKNFSIAFFFPAFITLLFFQHNRTVYDMVAGTIVVKRSRVR